MSRRLIASLPLTARAWVGSALWLCMYISPVRHVLCTIHCTTLWPSYSYLCHIHIKNENENVSLAADLPALQTDRQKDMSLSLRQPLRLVAQTFTSHSLSSKHSTARTHAMTEMHAK
ncbi:hypothetical protein BZA05DRAFT_142493 [Tricharina praecox]|uniref:uncharacterized protein n=1 Tax=Tricharina praecox TaxID=43433 RepID=UPI0022206DBF|nr:uncharacterized protein BZA05DRAFT_142493 [Tricharina praecox]KAI5845933.1 hypothetical protein BZA05DRAFT_142493 [Tricharina praecox]